MPDGKLITVTQEDIDHGVAQDCDQCPIARAARRVWPTARTIAVSDEIALTWSSGLCELWVLPVSAERFVHAFDSGFAVSPFEFITTWQEDDL